MVRQFAVLTCALASTVFLEAEDAWVQRAAAPVARSGFGMAPDVLAGRSLFFGGSLGISQAWNDTWTWDGTDWVKRLPPVVPPARGYPAMALDAGRGRVVLFGGQAPNAAPLSDTWEWDGTTWIERRPATVPPARYSGAMSYDPDRHRIVLFSGVPGQGYALNDTWEWDGTDWRLVSALGPQDRRGHAMAFDPVTRRVLLFGGMLIGSVFPGDTWSWDGTTWSPVATAARPPGRSGHVMAADVQRQVVTLFGGYDGRARLGDTWDWTGSNWIQRSPAAAPAAREQAGMAFDAQRGRTVMFGGRDGAPPFEVLYRDTWEWDGSTWAERSPVFPGRGGYATAFDSVRQRTVLFGAENQTSAAVTWEWDGVTWSKLSPSASPPARAGHAMAYDGTRRKVVMFGGSWTGGTLYGDTWEWDGTTWAQRSTAVSPPSRRSHAMAFDASRGVVVLFGGHNGSGQYPYMADTWEWDGSRWLDRTSSLAPPQREDHGMCYDSVRRRCVLFGGGDAQSHALGDLWEWDGTNWASRNPSGGAPVGRSGPAIAFDSWRGVTVLFGGFGDPQGSLADTWEWDGISWTQRITSRSPSPRSHQPMVHDSTRGELVLFGDSSTSGEYSETWELRSTRRAGSYGVFGSACPGAQGLPVLERNQLPSVGAPFSLLLTHLPLNQPGVMFLGFDRTHWGLFVLPLNLAPVGMPGCQLYTSVDLAFPVGSSGPFGAAVWGIQLSNDPSQAGLRFYNQALFIDPGANALGAILTNAGAGVIGQ